MYIIAKRSTPKLLDYLTPLLRFAISAATNRFQPTMEQESVSRQFGSFSEAGCCSGVRVQRCVTPPPVLGRIDPIFRLPCARWGMGVED